MNIAVLLSSLNKIGMVAFLITFGFLVFELIQLRKASQARARPKVPRFQEGGEVIPEPENKKLVEKDEEKLIERNKSILLVLVVLLIFFGVVTLIGYFSLKSKSAKSQPFAPTLTTTQVAPPRVKAQDPEFTPTEIPTPSLTVTPTPEPTEEPLTTDLSPTPEETEVASPSPTTISQLPQTGYINNMLVIFSLAGLVIFFSFLF